jgi:hypothetical protein
VGHLPIFQWGEFTQMRSKDIPADHVTPGCLAKVCNGLKWCRKVHPAFVQFGVKMLCVQTHRKLLNCSALKYRQLQIMLLASQNSIKALRNEQWLRFAHYRVH